MLNIRDFDVLTITFMGFGVVEFVLWIGLFLLGVRTPEILFLEEVLVYAGFASTVVGAAIYIYSKIHEKDIILRRD